MPRALAVSTVKRPPGDGAGSAGSGAELDPETRRVYLEALAALRQGGVEFLIGGAHALAPYTGIIRDTKDLDVFLRKEDCEAALAVLGEAGFSTELTFPHWLGKAYAGDRFIDLIFGAGNGVAMVDDLWFAHATPGHVLGVPVPLCPPEEMIWSKAFIMERERYDGADIAHLILACGRELDWRRLLARFGRRWRVLLSHLILFGFIYPGERLVIPDAVMDHLLRRLERERARRGRPRRVRWDPAVPAAVPGRRHRARVRRRSPGASRGDDGGRNRALDRGDPAGSRASTARSPPPLSHPSERTSGCPCASPPSVTCTARRRRKGRSSPSSPLRVRMPTSCSSAGI